MKGKPHYYYHYYYYLDTELFQNVGIPRGVQSDLIYVKQWIYDSAFDTKIQSRRRFN